MVEMQSTITCPNCHSQATLAMPIDACVYLYGRQACGLTLKPKQGDCCVFCSYGPTICPTLQVERGICCSPITN